MKSRGQEAQKRNLPQTSQVVTTAKSAQTANALATRPQRHWLAGVIALGLVLVTFLLYQQVRLFGFLNWDDLTFITNNDHVKGGLTWESIKWVFTHSYSANWAPLSWISHMIDAQFYGLKPAGHHLTNVLLHSANAALLFLVLRAFTSATWRSAFVAALFAVHPLHVESVAWVAERRDVLSGFFFMLTLLAYERYARYVSVQCSVFSVQSSEKQTPKRSTLYGPRSLPLYALTLLLFALGLMSKPMLVTLPFLLLLLDFWPLKRVGWFTTEYAEHTEKTQPKSQIKNLKSKIWIEKLPFFALALASSIITFISQKQGGAVASLQTVTFSSRFENAAVAYVQYLVKFFWPINLSPFYPHPDHWEMWRVAGAVILLVVVTLLVWIFRREFPYLLVGWLWFLGTLVPVIGIVQVGSQAFADRYTYLPLIGIMIALTWLTSELAFHFPLLLAEPKLLRAGWGERVRVRASFVLSMLILGLLTWRTSAQLPYWRDTVTLFRRALQISPNSVQALYGLGTDLIDAGHVDEGLPYLKEAIRLQPRYPQALGAMGNLLDSQGKYAEAIEFYEAGRRADPNEPGILNNLAWLRAACADPTFRNGKEAVSLATRACEITSYSRPIFIGTLAAAQAEAGDFPSAIATAERAAALADKLHLNDTAARNRDLIELYRQGKAAHGAPPSKL